MHESSLDDYDEIDDNQRKELPHIISGYKKCKTKTLQTTPPTKPVQMKPQINRLQAKTSNANEHHWFLFITSNIKAKFIRQWNSILVFSQLGISTAKLSFAVPVPHGSFHFFWQPRSIGELHGLHVQFLLQRRQWEVRTTEKTKGLHHWVGRRRMNFQVDSFVLLMTWANFNRLRWNVFFLRYARMSFWHMTLTCKSPCFQNEMWTRFRFPFLTNRLLVQYILVLGY